jgi:uncharacterized repeat protein (TIGR01451 family)
MSRQTVNVHLLRFGVIAILAISLTMAFGGPQLALADPLSPLAVSKTANPSPVSSGAQVTYTITMVNTGGSKINSVVMTDQLNGVGGIGTPPQLALTTTQGSCAQSSLKVTCTIGSIAGGGSVTVTIRGIVTAANGTTLNNTASVTGTKSAQNFTTTATVQTLVQNNNPSPLADLSISKTGPSSVVQSSPMTYILTINNSGQANATNIRVVDTLPAGVGLSSVSGTSLFVCTSAGSPVTVTCDGGAVNQGSNATITINAVAPSATGGIANTAVVDPNNTIPESNELNNTSATVSTSVTSAPAPQGLTISKADSPDPVIPGAILSYTIIVNNIATSRADDVVVVDGTQGLEAASITASQVIVNGTVGTTGGCTVTAPQVRCSIRSLNPGGTQTITIRGQVVASAGSTIINTATVTGNIKNQGVTATATAQTTVMPAVDLTITKADSPDPVCARSWPQPPDRLPSPPDGWTAAGGTVPTLLADPGCLGGLTYTFVVGNSGTANASGVVVRDPLPVGLIFDSYSTDGGFTCAVDAANVVTCTGGAVPATSTRTLTLLLVAPPDSGTISNTVTVDPNNAIYEADETNNTFVQATTVTTGIDLVIRKDDSRVDPPGIQNVTDGIDPIATSGTETYVITVDNVGTQNVTGVRVRDTLPAGTKFLSVVADPTHGFTCAHDGSATGGIVECMGGHLLATESEFYDPAGTPPAGPGDDIATIKITVFARPTVGTMHNEVRVDPLNEIAEYNELNNLETEDTIVTNGGAALLAFNELKIKKEQTSPVDGSGNAIPVATNGVIIYTITVSNDATDPVGQLAPVVVKDTLPQGFRYIEAKDTAPGPAGFQCVQGANTQEVTCTAGGPLSGLVTAIPGVPNSRTITVEAFAANTPSSAAVVYTNQADVDPNNTIPEGDEFNNRASIVTTVVVGGANMFNELTISKTQTDPGPACPPTCPGTVATSSIVTWDIVVSNTGSDPAFNVKLTDTLPAGFKFISALDTSGPSDPFRFVCVPAAGNTADCTGATLSGTVNAAGTNPTTRTIVLKAFSSAIPGSYTNTAIVDPANAIPEGNETNNTANLTTIVSNGGPGSFIDLTIVKSGSLTASPGGPLNYSLLVTNTGAATAFNVKVRDVLPAHVTFINAADSAAGPGNFTCSYTAPNLDCTGGTLPGGGGSRTINIHAVAPTNLELLTDDQENISVTVTNQAFVDPDNAILEGDETNNADSIDTVVSSPINLTLTKEGPGSATQNDTTTYAITVTNNKIGPTGATALGVTIVDPLPVGLIPLNVSAEPGNFTCQVEENPVNFVTCVGDLETETSVTITIEAFVTKDGGELDNEACVDPDHTIDETNELDNCKHTVGQVTPLKPDLQINKSADSSVANIGQELQYTVSVSNVGNAATSETITMTDNLPVDVTLVSPGGVTAPAGWTCSGTTTITCDNTSGMTQGENAQFKIRVTVDSTASGTITNNASVNTVTGESTPANNSTSLTTSIGGSGVDLTISNITDVPDPVNDRPSQLTYTIIGQNNGAAAASGVVIRIDLPDSGISSPVAAGSNGFNCVAPVAGNIDCTGDLPAGSNTIITVVLTVDSGAPNDLKLKATIDPSNAFGESDETNNTEEETTTVTGAVCTGSPCFDLVVADIDASAQTINSGDSVTFTVSIVNIGDSPISPTAIWDIHLLYSGTTGTMSVTPPGGIVCANFPTPLAPPPADLHQHCKSTAVVDPMDLGPGEGLTLTVTVTTSSAGTGSLEVNADIFNAIPGEFDETNNTATEVIDVNP